VAKVTVYLPDDLAGEVRQHETLNISEVCQQGLRAEVRRRNAIANATSDIERVAARLRNHTIEDTSQHTQGYEAGSLWARERASWAELEELTRYLTRDYESFEPFEPPASLAHMLEAQFGRPIIGRMQRDPFSQGLLDGVRAVYEAVKSHLDAAAPQQSQVPGTGVKPHQQDSGKDAPR
jgi:post-segregation antitoxin (ccd killing protein)